MIFQPRGGECKLANFKKNVPECNILCFQRLKNKERVIYIFPIERWMATEIHKLK